MPAAFFTRLLETIFDIITVLFLLSLEAAFSSGRPPA
jgi:hypothetical protein